MLRVERDMRNYCVPNVSFFFPFFLFFFVCLHVRYYLCLSWIYLLVLFPSPTSSYSFFFALVLSFSLFAEKMSYELSLYIGEEEKEKTCSIVVLV